MLRILQAKTQVMKHEAAVGHVHMHHKEEVVTPHGLRYATLLASLANYDGQKFLCSKWKNSLKIVYVIKLVTGSFGSLRL